MKSSEVLKILGISRVTLSNYVKSNKIKVLKLHNGFYDYDDNDVLKLKGITSRKSIIYTRVSTKKQIKDLENQQKFIKNYCLLNNIHYDEEISDIDSGMTLDRNNIKNLILRITQYEIKNIIISNKDRLTRTGYSLLEDLCSQFKTEIIICDNTQTNNDTELLNEIVSIIHSFSMKLYSSRRKRRMGLIQETIELDTEIEND